MTLDRGRFGFGVDGSGCAREVGGEGGVGVLSAERGSGLCLVVRVMDLGAEGVGGGLRAQGW